jgi:hypothetical protein
MDPTSPPEASDITATLSPAAGGRFLVLAYRWRREGAPQDGLLVVGTDDAGATAVFIDSFHQRDAFMPCRGPVSERAVSVEGRYPAPPGPDWGWRITLDWPSAGELRLRMYNLEPDGGEQLAVDAPMTRAAV